MPNSDGSTEPTWRLLRVGCDASLSDLIAEMLWSAGVQAVEEISADAGEVVLRTYTTSEVLPGLLRRHFPGITVEHEDIAVAVADTWRAHVSATPIGGGHWIVPAWCDAPPGGESIFIEPGATFGLGDHPTTVLALRLALARCVPGEKVHDHGTGSGVLAVALTRWRGAVCSVDDIAPEALSAVEDNARRNGVGCPLWIDGLPGGTACVDAVVANILAPVLRTDARRIVEVVKVGGWIVLSGMRADQMEDVLGHYEGCEEIDRSSLEGWTAVTLRRVA